jgi:hypothetical protein
LEPAVFLLDPLLFFKLARLEGERLLLGLVFQLVDPFPSGLVGELGRSELLFQAVIAGFRVCKVSLGGLEGACQRVNGLKRGKRGARFGTFSQLRCRWGHGLHQQVYRRG